VLKTHTIYVRSGKYAELRQRGRKEHLMEDEQPTGAVSSLALATVVAVLVVSRAFATRWGQNPIRVAS
jgi:hypothetical protein